MIAIYWFTCTVDLLVQRRNNGIMYVYVWIFVWVVTEPQIPLNFWKSMLIWVHDLLFIRNWVVLFVFVKSSDSSLVVLNSHLILFHHMSSVKFGLEYFEDWAFSQSIFSSLCCISCLGCVCVENEPHYWVKPRLRS